MNELKQQAIENKEQLKFFNITLRFHTYLRSARLETFSTIMQHFKHQCDSLIQEMDVKLKNMDNFLKSVNATC